jgi:hypothetical protein
MQDHPRPSGADPLPPIERAQQLLLLELVVDPPVEGDRIPHLASRLNVTAATLTMAAAALQDAGLAVIDGEVVRASPAALRFEALLPACL